MRLRVAETGGVLVWVLSTTVLSTGALNADASCPADVAPSGGDGTVNIDDLLAIINNWGACPAPCPPHCLGDINQSCAVNVDDLLLVINSWGACPTCLPDSAEPDNSCAGTDLGTLELDDTTVVVAGRNLYPSGDQDYLYFLAKDVGHCVQDSQLVTFTLSVSGGAASDGPVQLCAESFDCNSGVVECFNVAINTTGAYILDWPEECLQDDSRYIVVRIKQNAPVSRQCVSYTLTIFAWSK